MLYHHFIADIDNQQGIYHREPYTEKEVGAIIKSTGLHVKNFFIHAETGSNHVNRKEIKAMTDRIKKKVFMIRGSDHYYFYKDKSSEVIKRLQKNGVHLPRHLTYVLRPV